MCPMTPHSTRNTLTEKERSLRNQNPHKAARLAMFRWGGSYAAQDGGSMDFWDKLSLSEKQLCREVIKQIERAPEEQ
jgi:hypothetical protein